MTKKKNFTLIELLVVISIISILTSMLLPSLKKAREKTKRAVCLSNLSQMHKCNMMYGDDNNSIMPPGNAVVNYNIGIISTEFIRNSGVHESYGLAYLYRQSYLDTADAFYCPSWTHPDFQKNKLNDSGTMGGYNDEDYPAPTRHYTTSYNYRGVFEDGEIRAPSLSLDSSSTPYLGDHWTKDMGQYVHTLDGYNILYMGGHAKFNYDTGKTILANNIYGPYHLMQGQFWDEFFKD